MHVCKLHVALIRALPLLLHSRVAPRQLSCALGSVRLCITWPQTQQCYSKTHPATAARQHVPVAAPSGCKCAGLIWHSEIKPAHLHPLEHVLAVTWLRACMQAPDRLCA